MLFSLSQAGHVLRGATWTVIVAIAFVIVSLVATSHAQPPLGTLAGPPPLFPLPAVAPHFPVPQGPSGDFTLGSPANPIPVSYSPTAGPFEKWLMPTQDQDFDGDVDVSDFVHFISVPQTLQEYFVVGSGPAWTDWHEQILTNDWIWGNAQITSGGTPPGPSNLLIQSAGAAIDFYFDPLVPGTTVDIRKQLLFTGNPTPAMINAFLQGNYMIRVAEYPTSVPEPSCVALAAFGCAMLGSLALRRRGRRLFAAGTRAAALLLAVARPSEAAVFHFWGGIPDNYALPTSPAFPSTGLQTFLGATNFKPYDSTALDQWFADTFENCPMCITGAELEIGLKPLTVTSGGANNDSIRFGFTDSFGNASGTFWGKNIGLPAGQQSVLPLNGARRTIQMASY